MASINYEEISEYVQIGNKLGEGKEVNVYSYHDKVIKIFHGERKTTIPRISEEGLLKLSKIPLNCFNKPIDIIYENGVVVGYTEKFLKEDEINFDCIRFDIIKQDVKILSENGFMIDDLFYNYIFTSECLYFCDLTCYHYVNTTELFLKNYFLKKNLEIMNTFLIGLIEFDAFRNGEKKEYTKIYLANQYRLENCSDIFYGDFIQKRNNKGK